MPRHIERRPPVGDVERVDPLPHATDDEVRRSYAIRFGERFARAGEARWRGLTKRQRSAAARAAVSARWAKRKKKKRSK
jgi:hypothetical protein